MKVDALTGNTFVARGLRYIPQSASLLKYLSIPVMMGPTPKPILNTHQLRLRRSSKSFIVASYPREPPVGDWIHIAPKKTFCSRTFCKGRVVTFSAVRA